MTESGDPKPPLWKPYSDSAWASEVAVLADDARGIVSTGIYDTTRYTSEVWDLFDRCVEYLEAFGD